MPRLVHASLEDIPQLCELLALLFGQEAEFVPDRTRQEAGLREIITHPDVGRILILREGAAVIAMVNLLFTVSTALGGRVALLEDMLVHPAHRGSGAGSRLLQAAVEFARSAGCLRITLLTDGDNTAAQRFYQRHGFESSAMLTMRLSLCD
jgi:GNAT superfamily N-acetyltransferase